MQRMNAVLEQGLENISQDGGDSGVYMRIETTSPHDRAIGQSQTYDVVPRNVSTAIPQIHRQGMSPSPIRTYTSWGRQSRIMLDRSKVRNRNFIAPMQTEPTNVCAKGISLSQAIDARPPLRKDMIGPTSTTYSPCNKPLYETNAPSFSFGRREANKKGSGQKAWGKLWFRSHSPFTFKTNYEQSWPSPFHYNHKSAIGNAGPTIGVRRNIQKSPPSIESSVEEEEDPDLLYPKPVWKRAPAYTMGVRIPCNYWTPKLKVPAANTYNVMKPTMKATKRSVPAYTLCGVRRHKQHQLGPFATL